MRLAFFGNGQMGRVAIARARGEGHEIGVTFTSWDAGQGAEELAGSLRGHDAAIDFSVAAAVYPHAAACARAGVPLVEGTTGWREQEADVRHVVQEAGGAMVYGPNFSIGVNLFYRLVGHAAELFQGLALYDAFIEEAHHARKKDAPSGTAFQLRSILAARGREVPIASTRAGHIPGTHRVGFDSSADQIMLTHMARSRDGFAAGALLAARWIAARRNGAAGGGGGGVYAFTDVLNDILDLERGESR
jgi:4-hydroxy-tetrahydrodipicolinate reductase